MAYIVESVCPRENLVTIYYRFTLNGAHELARFLKDEYNVETEVYTEDDYIRLYPEKFREHHFDNIFESDKTESVGKDWDEKFGHEKNLYFLCLVDAGVYDEEGNLLDHDSWDY